MCRFLSFFENELLRHILNSLDTFNQELKKLRQRFECWVVLNYVHEHMSRNKKLQTWRQTLHHHIQMFSLIHLGMNFGDIF